MGERAQEREHIEHGIAPVFDGRSEVLVLGTMPSPASREAAFFYGHPQNRFWRVLAALFDEPVPVTNGERTMYVPTCCCATISRCGTCWLPATSVVPRTLPSPMHGPTIWGAS